MDSGGCSGWKVNGGCIGSSPLDQMNVVAARTALATAAPAFIHIEESVVTAVIKRNNERSLERRRIKAHRGVRLVVIYSGDPTINSHGLRFKGRAGGGSEVGVRSRGKGQGKGWDINTQVRPHKPQDSTDDGGQGSFGYLFDATHHVQLVQLTKPVHLLGYRRSVSLMSAMVGRRKLITNSMIFV